MSLFAKFPRIKTVLQVYRLRTLYKETTKARGLTHKKVPIYNFVTAKKTAQHSQHFITKDNQISIFFGFIKFDIYATLWTKKLW